MSVPEQMPIVVYIANGTTTRFPITFDLHDVGYLNVFINKELAPIGSYTVDNFEAVVFTTTPNENDEITLIRDTQLDRETNYQSFDNSFRPAAVNYDFDKIWHVLQEQNLIDGKILARLKAEIEWRRTHDFNYDELAQAREKQLFDALKGYTDTLVAAVSPGIFQGVIAGVVFARDGKSVQTHIEEILAQLEIHRTDVLTEKNRAMAAESALDEQIQQTKVDIAIDIASEANRAKLAEDNLQLQITTSANSIKYFSTFSELNAFVPTETDPKQAYVFETSKNYLWVGNAWKDEGKSVLDKSKDYTNSEIEKIKNPTNTHNDLHQFTDANGTIVASIGKEGAASFVDVKIKGKTVNEIVKTNTTNMHNDLHQFTDANGTIVASIGKEGNFIVMGETLNKTDKTKVLHQFTDINGNSILAMDQFGRLIGVKPFDLSIDALFANATSDDELIKIGLYHDYIKSIKNEKYKFTKLVYEINESSDGKTNEIAARMPSIVQVAKNKIFVSYAVYREGALADQTHAAMVGRFVTFDTKNKTATVDTNTVLMAGDRESNTQAHRHAAFAKVLNKETGKFRYICLFNRGTLRLNDSELNLIYSDDDCKTWSAIQTIMTESQPEPFYLIPCTLVEIPHGTFKGRLVTGVFRQTQNETSSEIAVLFSDDQGVTWKIGGKLQSGAFDQYGTFGFLNETMITVDNQGNLLFGIRNENSTLLESRVMLWARSYDGGNTILVEDEPHLVTALAEGSLVQAASHLHEGIPKILYSYPSAPTIGSSAYVRRNPKIAVSYNNGKAFQVQYAVRPGTNVVTGYSHLIRTSDQDFILVEETSGKIELTFLNMSEILTNGVIKHG